MRVEDEGGAPVGDRRLGGSRVAGVGFREPSSESSASRPEVEDGGLWDVFLADDLDEEPQPEWGDFWLDGQ